MSHRRRINLSNCSYFVVNAIITAFQDGSKVFSASCDNTVMSWDFGGQQGTQVAAVR